MNRSTPLVALALFSFGLALTLVTHGQERSRITLPSVVQLTRPLSSLEYTYDLNMAATGSVPVLVARLYSAHEVSTNLPIGVEIRSRGFIELDVTVSRQEAYAALASAGVPQAAVTSAYDNLRWSAITSLYFRVAYQKVTGVLTRVSTP